MREAMRRATRRANEMMAAIDVDGTLVDDEGRVIPENEAAIRRAIASGAHIVIATGRPYQGVGQIIRELGLTDPVVTLGGSVVTSASGEMCRSYPIPPARVREIYGFCGRRGLSVRAHSDDGLFAHFRNPGHPDIPALEERVRDWLPYHIHTVGHDGDMPVKGVYKVTILTEDESMMKRLRPEVEAEFTSLNYALSYPRWLEFTASGTNKVRGVRYVARMLGVRQRDVMAVGDNENDLAMIKWAGMGIYVESAPANLKAFARLSPPKGIPAVAWGLSQMLSGGVLGAPPVPDSPTAPAAPAAAATRGDVAPGGVAPVG